jgi:hypothetical protein
MSNILCETLITIFYDLRTVNTTLKIKSVIFLPCFKLLIWSLGTFSVIGWVVNVDKLCTLLNGSEKNAHYIISKWIIFTTFKKIIIYNRFMFEIPSVELLSFSKCISI